MAKNIFSFLSDTSGRKAAKAKEDAALAKNRYKDPIGSMKAEGRGFVNKTKAAIYDTNDRFTPVSSESQSVPAKQSKATSTAMMDRSFNDVLQSNNKYKSPMEDKGLTEAYVSSANTDKGDMFTNMMKGATPEDREALKNKPVGGFGGVVDFLGHALFKNTIRSMQEEKLFDYNLSVTQMADKAEQVKRELDNEALTVRTEADMSALEERKLALKEYKLDIEATNAVYDDTATEAQRKRAANVTIKQLAILQAKSNIAATEAGTEATKANMALSAKEFDQRKYEFDQNLHNEKISIEDKRTMWSEQKDMRREEIHNQVDQFNKSFSQQSEQQNMYAYNSIIQGIGNGVSTSTSNKIMQAMKSGNKEELNSALDNADQEVQDFKIESLIAKQMTSRNATGPKLLDVSKDEMDAFIDTGVATDYRNGAPVQAITIDIPGGIFSRAKKVRKLVNERWISEHPEYRGQWNSSGAVDRSPSDILADFTKNKNNAKALAADPNSALSTTKDTNR